MGDTLRFLGAFLRHPGSVGAVAPSSRFLARAMVRGLDVPPGQCVVEFGPGTGPFTRAIADCLGDSSAYLGIEREPRFVATLRERFPDLRIIEGSAEDAPAYHEETGLGPVAAVLCGLPFASLPPAVQDRIVEALDRLLAAGGEFRTFQYVHAYPLPTAVRFRRRMTERFGPVVRSRAVLRNLPPAFVLRWRR